MRCTPDLGDGVVSPEISAIFRTRHAIFRQLSRLPGVAVVNYAQGATLPVEQLLPSRLPDSGPLANLKWRPMMAGATIALFNMMTVKPKDNWGKLKTVSTTFHQEASAELGAVCVFVGLGLAATLLVALFGDVSELAQALAMAG